MGVPWNEEMALPLRASSQQCSMGLHTVAVNEEGRASLLVMAEKVHPLVDASLVLNNCWWADDVRPRPQALQPTMMHGY
jgi:hypothetical protein